MIDIEKTSFCGLSTSSAWQTWLYNTDGDLYRSFIDRLLTNKGCSDNRKLMEEYYQIMMNDPVLAAKFIDFIKSEFPFMIKNLPDPTYAELDKLFGSGILTMPRRAIIHRNLHGFLSDKLKYFVLESDDHFYVEYLNNDDLFLIDKIPDDKWILSKYNARSNING